MARDSGSDSSSDDDVVEFALKAGLLGVARRSTGASATHRKPRAAPGDGVSSSGTSSSRVVLGDKVLTGVDGGAGGTGAPSGGAAGGAGAACAARTSDEGGVAGSEVTSENGAQAGGKVASGVDDSGSEAPEYAPRATVACARAGCVPCCYKLLVQVPKGERGKYMPNARPETCPRLKEQLTGIVSAPRGMSSAPAGKQARGKKRRKRKRKADEEVAGEFAAGEAGGIARAGLYTKGMRILTVGDGNFSFSRALANAIGEKRARGGAGGVTAGGPDFEAMAKQLQRSLKEEEPVADSRELDGRSDQDNVVVEEEDPWLVATSYEHRDAVVRIYDDGEDILAQLRSVKGVAVRHGVNGAALSMASLREAEHDDGGIATASLKTPFDRIVWNFPCIPALDDGLSDGASGTIAAGEAGAGFDGQLQHLDANQKLLRGFFTRCAEDRALLERGGEVHVTHKTKAGFALWKIEELAREAGLRLEGRVVFDRVDYPGYVNKKALTRGSFPIVDSRTFVFVRAAETSGDATSIPRTLLPAPTPATTRHAQGVSLVAHSRVRAEEALAARRTRLSKKARRAMVETVPFASHSKPARVVTPAALQSPWAGLEWCGPGSSLVKVTPSVREGIRRLLVAK